eukprot:SAG25_NODE_1142_length_3812_cov_1.523027_3_plen_124_part_00
MTGVGVPATGTKPGGAGGEGGEATIADPAVSAAATGTAATCLKKQICVDNATRRQATRPRAEDSSSWSHYSHAGMAVALAGATSAATTAAVVRDPAIETPGALNAAVMAAGAMGLPAASGATV